MRQRSYSPTAKSSSWLLSTSVRRCGIAITYASADLRSDREIILVAVNTCGYALQFAMGDHLLSCTIGENKEFMETILQTLLDHDQIVIIGGFYCLHCLPGLKAVLVGLTQELNNVNHFSIRGDLMPDVLARRLIARQEEIQWCLARACQSAGVSMDAQQTVVQFTTIARDSQTGRQLLTYSRIVYMSMKLLSHNFHNGSNW